MHMAELIRHCKLQSLYRGFRVGNLFSCIGGSRWSPGGGFAPAASNDRDILIIVCNALLRRSTCNSRVRGFRAPVYVHMYVYV